MWVIHRSRGPLRTHGGNLFSKPIRFTIASPAASEVCAEIEAPYTAPGVALLAIRIIPPVLRVVRIVQIQLNVRPFVLRAPAELKYLESTLVTIRI